MLSGWVSKWGTEGEGRRGEGCVGVRRRCVYGARPSQLDGGHADGNWRKTVVAQGEIGVSGRAGNLGQWVACVSQNRHFHPL